MPSRIKAKKEIGNNLRFRQTVSGKDLILEGKIHEVCRIKGKIVYHVEILGTDAVLWALVAEDLVLREAS